MVSNSLLVKIPSSPFRLDTLRPDAYLAKLAGHLIDSGHQTTIWDYGTLEMLQRLYPVSMQKTALERVDRKWTEQVQPKPHTVWDRWKRHGELCELEQHQEIVWAEIAQSIIDQKTIDFVLFNVTCEFDQAVCEHIVPLIRHARPHLQLLGAGDFFQNDSAGLPDCIHLFDCIFLGSSGDTFMHWVDRRTTPEHWHMIPHLAYSDGVRMYVTNSDRSRVPLNEVFPDYSVAVYPALHESTKILYFDIEEVHKEDASGFVHLKTPERIIEEIKHLSEQFKTMAFHFKGSLPDTRHAEALAHEILNRNLNIRYTRECHVASMPPSAIGVLSASGCYGVDFRIDTGSQRLLDNYYAHPFGVTQAEQTIRACKFSNLFTCVNFSYPCVEDDYHTKAETVRLIHRSKPHGTLVSIPPQEHRRTTDLKQRHHSEPEHRSTAEIFRIHDQLCVEVEEYGISTHMTPRLALLADLSGYRGQEDEFLQGASYQLMAGDVVGIEAMIDRINQASKKASNAIKFTPFSRLQYVVGN